MLEKEPNGKGAESPLVPDPSPTATDWSAGATVKPLPILGRVSNMAERQRDRDPAPTTASGATFTVNLGELVKLAGLIAAAAAMWWSLKGDLRDMKTTMDFQTKIQEERWVTQTASLREVKAKGELLALDIDEIKLALARAGILGAEVRIDGRQTPGGNGR